MREGQLFGYFGIFLGAFALIGLLLIIPAAVCVPLGVVCGVRALRRQQRLLGGIAISLCSLAAIALVILLILNAGSVTL
jgi:hypothetical protein